MTWYSKARTGCCNRSPVTDAPLSQNFIQRAVFILLSAGRKSVPGWVRGESFPRYDWQFRKVKSCKAAKRAERERESLAHVRAGSCVRACHEMRRGSKTYLDLADTDEDEDESMPFTTSSAKYEDVDALYGTSSDGRSGATFHLKEEEHHLDQLQKMARFECKDYDICDSQLNKLTNSVKSKKEYNIREALCWLLPIVIGVCMGFIAFLVDLGIEAIVTFRYERTKEHISANSTSFALPLFIFVSLAVAFTCVAGGLVAYVEPLAAGSGIPEVKTYLNGVHMKRLLSVHTLVSKLWGIMFSIGAGLIAGKEGPFVHGGAIVGSGVAAMASKTIGWKLGGKYANLFRNDVDHREFTAIGTAAGVATAFGAPIGGALFTIEEGCSFYSTFVFWRCFIATCSGVLTLHGLVEALYTNFDVSEAKLGNHRDFGLYSDGDVNYGANFW